MGCTSSVGAATPPASHKLPPAVRSALKAGKAAHRSVQPCDSGFVLEGHTKFLGTHVDGTRKIYEKSNMEIRTVFVRNRDASIQPRSLKDQALAQLQANAVYSEFVTGLDEEQRTWTIERAFLNNGLPSGHCYGARALADHLNMGSPICSSLKLNQIETIRLSNVVNTNTYMLMAVAALKEQSWQEVFGDHCRHILSEELRSSSLSFQDLTNASLTDIFIQTALGKLVNNILALWRQDFGIDMVVRHVSVSFDDSKMEYIVGENRRCMNICLEMGLAKLAPIDVATTVSTFSGSSRSS